jgi:hypothetical protein
MLSVGPDTKSIKISLIFSSFMFQTSVVCILLNSAAAQVAYTRTFLLNKLLKKISSKSPVLNFLSTFKLIFLDVSGAAPYASI